MPLFWSRRRSRAGGSPGESGLAALVCLVTLAAGGCALDLRGDGPPERTYWLEAPERSARACVGALAVTAVPGLRTDRLLALEADQRLVPYAGAHWAGEIPLMTESLLRQSLVADRGEQALQVEVRRFFVDRSASGSEAVIDLAVRTDEPQPVAANFTARARVADDRLSAVVSAFQQALDQVTADLAGWRAEAGKCPVTSAR